MGNREEALIRTRTTLLARLKDWDDQRSWQEFFDIYWPLIYQFARKGGLTDAEAQDVVQETMMAVSKQMPRFAYNPALGSFKGWLLTQTRWRMVDQFRKRGPVHPRKAEATDRTDSVERIPDDRIPDPDEIWETEWQKNILAAALGRVKQQLDPRKFQIFDFYVTREWPPEKVAQTFNVAVNQVYLVKNRVTEMLRREVERLEREVV